MLTRSKTLDTRQTALREKYTQQYEPAQAEQIEEPSVYHVGQSTEKYVFEKPILYWKKKNGVKMQISEIWRLEIDWTKTLHATCSDCQYNCECGIMTGKCCHCANQREFTTLYVDGMGDFITSDISGYCNSCRFKSFLVK